MMTKAAEGWGPLVASPGLKRYLARSRRPSSLGIAVLPLTIDHLAPPTTENFVYSREPRFLNLTQELFEELSVRFPVDVDPSGFTGPTGIPGNFMGVLTVAGCPMSPAPIPLLNNQSLRDELGLSVLKAEHKPLLVEMIRLVFGEARPADFTFTKAASTGLPSMITDPGYKKKVFMNMVSELDTFLDLATGNNTKLRLALERYHLTYGYVIYNRSQPLGGKLENGKPVFKKRQVPNEADAREGRYVPDSFADTTVRDSLGNPRPMHCAERKRAVFGAPFCPNSLLAAMMMAHRACYMESLEFSFKIRSRDHLASKLAPFSYVVGFDVTAMDTTIPDWFFEVLLDELHKYWDPRMVEVLRRLLHAPFALNYPWTEDGPRDYSPFFGNPFDSTTFDMKYGLPSGIGPNPDLGKVMMTFVYIAVAYDLGVLTGPADVLPFLQGRNPKLVTFCCADDVVMATNSKVLADQLRVARSPYMLLGPESPMRYLGMVGALNSAGQLTIIPDATTLVVNAFVPERPITTKPLSSFAIGVAARQSLYTFAPAYAEVTALTDRITKKWLGVVPRHLAPHIALNPWRSEADNLFVVKGPSVLQYRLDPSQISPELLDDHVGVIRKEDFFHHMAGMFCPGVLQ